jgi:hypothetical protein
MQLTDKQAKLIDSADQLLFFCQCAKRSGVASKAADRVAALARKHDSSAGFWLAGALTELRHGLLQEHLADTAADEEYAARARREATKHYDEQARQFRSFRLAVARS